MTLFQLLLLDALFAAVAATGFAVISNPPVRAVVVSALLSAVGHSFRFYLLRETPLDIATATFIAAFLMGSISLYVAGLIHCPNEVFTFPSLLPMIPGMYAYNMFLSLAKFIRLGDSIEHQALIEDIFSNGLSAVFIMIALVVGVSLPVMLFRKESFAVTRKNRSAAAK